jgi:phenylacetate-CoA ligase
MRTEPLYRWLVPRVIAPLGERFHHPRWTTARRLAALQWEAPEALERYALGRLRELLDHAGRHVPYYRELFARLGFQPGDLRRISDLTRIDVTTKAGLRNAFPARTVAENLGEGRRQPMMTSGSTGAPFQFFWDRAAVPGMGGTDWFWLDWAGAAPWHTRVVIASPAYFYDRLSPRRRWAALRARIVFGERSERLAADRLTVDALRSLVTRLRTRGPYYIRAYPGPLAGLAAQIEAEGRPLAAAPLAVISFAETLTPSAAAVISRAFRAPLVNYYSCWEVPQIAQSCPDVPDVLHVNADRVIVRVVRPDGRDAAPGEPGQVVVTDLANFVMPFINYATGDGAVAGAPCPCGRGLPTLARIEGRTGEVISTLGGREISGVALGQFLAFVAGIIPYVREYQAVQRAVDEVSLRVVPTPDFDNAFRVTLERELGRFLGPGMTVTVDVVTEIPLEPSGKRLIIKPLAGAPTAVPAR